MDMIHGCTLPALLLGGLVAFSAQASQGNVCGDSLAVYLAAAYPSATLNEGGWVLTGANGDRIRTSEVACKQWPADPSRSLLAVRVVPSVESESEYSEIADLEVLVVDSEFGGVEARRRESGRLDSDAIRVTGLQLDTARYRIADGTTAFGVRIDRVGSSQPNPWNETVLALFVVEPARLRPVLDSLKVSHFGGEWNTVCEGKFHSVDRVVAIEPHAGSWADLRVISRASTRLNVLSAEGECERIQAAPEISAVVLRYDGERYPVPEALSGH